MQGLWERLEAEGVDLMGEEILLECPTDPVHIFRIVYLEEEDEWAAELRIKETGTVDGETGYWDDLDKDSLFNEVEGLGFTQLYRR